jgi:hypothetical protein
VSFSLESSRESEQGDLRVFYYSIKNNEAISLDENSPREFLPLRGLWSRSLALENSIGNCELDRAALSLFVAILLDEIPRERSCAAIVLIATSNPVALLFSDSIHPRSSREIIEIKLSSVRLHGRQQSQRLGWRNLRITRPKSRVNR